MKLLISIYLFTISIFSLAQVSVITTSPESLSKPHRFGYQKNTYGWPGEINNNSWGLTTDFNQPNTFIHDTLVLVSDSTSGQSPFGHSYSSEGCNSILNNLQNKIALIYIGECSVTTQAINAQNAGAIGCVFVNTNDDTPYLTADTGGPGTNVTIPCITIGKQTGDSLSQALLTDTIMMLIGNKLNANSYDLSIHSSSALLPEFTSENNHIFDGFDLGLKVYNHGTENNTFYLTAVINTPNGISYSDTIQNLSLPPGDTLSIFPDDTFSFLPYVVNFQSYVPSGNYSLTYSIHSDSTDAIPSDNVIYYPFKLTNNFYSRARTDDNGIPLGRSYPVTDSTTSDHSKVCMYFETDNANNLGGGGYALFPHRLHFIPYWDTSTYDHIGSILFLEIYQWNNQWESIHDSNYDFNPSLNSPAYDSLAFIWWGDNWANFEPLTSGKPHYVTIEANNTSPSNLPFIQNNTKYLFCVTSFLEGIQFAYDNSVDYSTNQQHYGIPYAPVYQDSIWYTFGIQPDQIPALSLEFASYGSIDEHAINSITVFPNPTSSKLNLITNWQGNAEIEVADLTGRVWIKKYKTLDFNENNIDISQLNPGTYILKLRSKETYSSVKFIKL